MRPWVFGNTTVRSPFRLRDGLIALANSALLGRIKGRDQENAFAHLLDENGIVRISREDADVSDLGRKWRVALCQLGFIVPALSPQQELDQTLIGEQFTLTVNGRRLIEAESVPGMQECFLRSLAAYYIPSVLEEDYDYAVFSPLRHTLAVMLELERRTGDNYLGFLEMGLIVQLTSTGDELTAIADWILGFRSKRDAAARKRQFDRQALDEATAEHDYVASTFTDYADTNFRYIKATGLIHSNGRGLAIVPEKHLFVEQLVADTDIPDTHDYSYLVALGNGATLPTDNRDTAQLVLNDLVSQAHTRGIPFDLVGRNLDDTGDIAIIRHEIEQLIAEKNEDEYADRQAKAWEEIAAYMELIFTRRKSLTLDSGEEIKVPQGEVPAYFEWVLWRAFLAINSLLNKPYEARRFNVDQDFLPIGTAPGNGPDLILEFDDFVLVVEVTLTESSRQEAAEGEPVRRHVADRVYHYGSLSKKPVYGLFIANRIDSNTAETFRIGGWYTSDDERIQLDIIPVTLSQFQSFFQALFNSGNAQPGLVRTLLDRCSSSRNVHEAPAWKLEIDREITTMVEEISVR